MANKESAQISTQGPRIGQLASAIGAGLFSAGVLRTDSITFERALRDVRDGLRSLLGNLHDSHQLTRWLTSAAISYQAGNFHLGCTQATKAKLVLEDFQILAASNPELFQKLRGEIRKKVPDGNYYGIRQEVRVAATLASKGVAVLKCETPDLLLADFPAIGFECTSVHLDKPKPADVSYKIASAILSKSAYVYRVKFPVLAIDTTSVLFNDALNNGVTIGHRRALSNKIRHVIESSKFQSVIQTYYASVAIGEGNGALLHSCFARFDRKNIDSDVKAFLDIHYPPGDAWLVGRIQPVV